MAPRKFAFVEPLVPGAMFFLVACGGPLTYTPHGTARAPEADAHITATLNHDQSNTHVQLSVEHLAPPDRISPGGTSFVVWERRDQNAQWIRIGTIAYDTGNRTGALDATAPDMGFELTITVETDASPTSPSANIILDQRVGNAPERSSNGSAGTSAAPQST